MISLKAREFISENSTSIGLLLKVEGQLEIYHADDDFTTQGLQHEYVVGTQARYKYLKKKRKGQDIPPHIELADLEILADTILKEGHQLPSQATSVVPPLPNTPEETSSSLLELDEDLFNTAPKTDEIEEDVVPSPTLETQADETLEVPQISYTENPSHDNFLDIRNRPFVPNRVLIVPIERSTTARVTDFLFHNNNLLSGDGLRGVVDAYFQN